jgi:hypothetical protein
VAHAFRASLSASRRCARSRAFGCGWHPSTRPAHVVLRGIAALAEIRSRLDKAVGIGRAADACAGAGFLEKGLEVALDIEQLLYEATTLLKAGNAGRNEKLPDDFFIIVIAPQL